MKVKFRSYSCVSSESENLVDKPFLAPDCGNIYNNWHIDGWFSFGFSFMLLRTIAIKFIAFLSVFITIYKSLLCLGVLIGLREFLQANQFHY